MTGTYCRVDKKIKIYALAAIILSVLISFVRIICLFNFYDSDIGYYSKGILPSILNLSILAGVVFFASAFFTVKRDIVCSDGKEDNTGIKVASVLPMLAFGAFFVLSVLKAVFATNEASTLFDIIAKLTALMSLVYFAMNLFAPTVNRNLQTLCGFGIIIWNIYVLGVTYFDIYVQLNSPNKVILHLAIISAMVFFVNEFYCFVGNMRKGFYLFSLCSAVLFSSSASIPSLVYGLLTQGTDYKYFVYDIVFVALYVYFIIRLLSFASAKVPAIIEENQDVTESISEEKTNETEPNE